ncbi:MAG: ketopantoate reductase family protein [Dehalococcoidia bacterium]
MRMLIVGGGGLGTVYAGYLARSGVDVTLLVKPHHAAAFEGQEVHITGMAEFSVPVRVVSAVDPHEQFDYLIVAVKGRDTEQALAGLAGMSLDSVLSVQNGVRKNDILGRFFGWERVLGAVSMVGGTLLRPGHARHSLAMATFVGELDGSRSSRGERLAAAIQAAGLTAASVTDIATREWDKLAGFLRTALVCAIVHTDIASALLDPDLNGLCVAIVKEVAQVAAAEGHPLGASADSLVGDPDRSAPALAGAYRDLGAAMRRHGPPTLPSLAQDVIAGRPTELEETAGDVLDRAARHGITTPVLSTCAALLRARERLSSKEITAPE